MGKGRSGQHGMGHNLCLVNKPKKEGESVVQPRSGTESWSVPCESGGAPPSGHCLLPWIWSCRLLGPGDISCSNPGEPACSPSPTRLSLEARVRELTRALPDPRFPTRCPGLGWHCTALPEAWTPRWL